MNDQIQQLEDDVLALGDLVKGLLIEALGLLRDSNLDALGRFNDEKRQVHRKRLTIEMGCLSLIATRYPRNGELRSLVAMVEIATALGCMADHAQRIARANYLAAAPPPSKPLASLQRLAAQI